MMRYVAVLLVLLASTGAWAQIYKWEDKNGVVHMSTTPPQESDGDVRVIKEEDDLPSTNLVFLGTLYTKESYAAERDRLKDGVHYYKNICPRNSTQRQGMSDDAWEARCAGNAQRTQRSLEILTSDPDRYFYVMDKQKNSRYSQRDKSIFYRPWE